MLTLISAARLFQTQNRNYLNDLSYLTDSIRKTGAYIRQDGFDPSRIYHAYEAKFAAAKDQTEALRLLEQVIAELHDFHAALGVNDQHSPRLVPTGADVYAEWRRGLAIVVEVRPGSLAEESGIQTGDKIVRINHQSIMAECQSWLGVRKNDPRAMNWALNMALAGRWDTEREFEVRRDSQTVRFRMRTAKNQSPKSVLTVRHDPHGILYLRPENSLGDANLIDAFDQIRKDIVRARRIVLDLRNTPSGGDSSVARGILGHFVKSRRAFQRHVEDEPNTDTVHDWVEYANPRFPDVSHAKVAVLVDRWTGSMGEGLAIGMDATGSGTVIGTPMAGLRGAISSIELPVSKYRVFFPTERIYHVDGTPREKWKPSIEIRPGSGDPWMKAARKLFGLGSR